MDSCGRRGAGQRIPFLVSPSVTFSSVQAPGDAFRGVTLNLKGRISPHGVGGGGGGGSSYSLGV